MRTKLTKKDVESGKFDVNDYYEIFDSASNTLRAIYVMFGWNHMVKDLHCVNNTIDDLAESAVKNLSKDNDYSTSCATGGMKVSAFYENEGTEHDAEFILNIDISFEVV